MHLITSLCEVAAEASLTVPHQSGVLVSLPVADSKNTDFSSLNYILDSRTFALVL